MNRRTIRKAVTTHGYEWPIGTTQLATGALPVDNPPHLIGVDAVAYDGPGTYTFRQLVDRVVSSDPLSKTANARSNPLSIADGDMLILVVTAGTPQVKTSKGLVIPGAFFRAGSYQEFATVIVEGTGIAYATLYWQPAL